jgi:hypothetical protein
MRMMPCESMSWAGEGAGARARIRWGWFSAVELIQKVTSHIYERTG